MSRKGNCWDNAVAESFFSTLEHECIQGRVFSDLEHARSVFTDYFDNYNPVRLHSTNGFKSPIILELDFLSQPQAAQSDCPDFGGKPIVVICSIDGEAVES